MSAEHRSHHERLFRRLYIAAIALKGLDGVTETLSGAVFLFVSQHALRNWIFRITAPELIEDPDDLVANLLRRSFSHLQTGTKVAAGAYLLGHGIIKITLVAALLRRRRWALICGAALLGLAIVGEAVRYVQTHSLTLLGALVFDLVVLALVWREYRRGEFGR